MTPLSPAPMSPPMSAKSFGTFIDSAPSTPAYSPRQEGGEWGNSQITILRPMSSSSLPSSPTEPAWEMMAPIKQPAHVSPPLKDCSIVKPKLTTASSSPLILSKPVKKTKSVPPKDMAPTDDRKMTKLSTKEDKLRQNAEMQARKLVEEQEVAAATNRPQETADNSPPEPSPKTDTAPLGKLATRMKSLLRRNTSEKRKEKKGKTQQEFDRLEDAHWSEM